MYFNALYLYLIIYPRDIVFNLYYLWITKNILEKKTH